MDERQPSQDSGAAGPFEYVLAEYLQAAEAAQEVSGREAVRREFLSRHPDLAEDLRKFFAGEQVFQRLSPLPAAGEGEATTGDRVSDAGAGMTPGARVRYFGDYELLEEIGRGGMGVVFKARQVSLGREVAVK